MKWFDELFAKAARLGEKSFFWKQFFAWAPPSALVFGIDWLVNSHFSSLDPETADTKCRNAMILIGVIALCLSPLLRPWARKDNKSHRWTTKADAFVPGYHRGGGLRHGRVSIRPC